MVRNRSGQEASVEIRLLFVHYSIMDYEWINLLPESWSLAPLPHAPVPEILYRNVRKGVVGGKKLL